MSEIESKHVIKSVIKLKWKESENSPVQELEPVELVILED